MICTHDCDLHLQQMLDRMCDESLRLALPGVAVVGFLHPDQGLRSFARVRGALIGDDANFLAIAYTKLAEMCDTGCPSGSGIRPAYRGEFAYVGGSLITATHGIYLAAFSGATSEEDLAISLYGLQVVAMR